MRHVKVRQLVGDDNSSSFEHFADFSYPVKKWPRKVVISPLFRPSQRNKHKYNWHTIYIYTYEYVYLCDRKNEKKKNLLVLLTERL